MSSTPIGDGHRFPACAKPWHGLIVWTDASAGGGRSERIMLGQKARAQLRFNQERQGSRHACATANGFATIALSGQRIRQGGRLKPAPFAYAKARSLEDAVALLGDHHGEAKLLAGGQSLIATLNMRLSQPSFLVEI